jgi:hypothetical protein
MIYAQRNEQNYDILARIVINLQKPWLVSALQSIISNIMNSFYSHIQETLVKVHENNNSPGTEAELSQEPIANEAPLTEEQKQKIISEFIPEWNPKQPLTEELLQKHSIPIGNTALGREILSKGWETMNESEIEAYEKRLEELKNERSLEDIIEGGSEEQQPQNGVFFLGGDEEKSPTSSNNTATAMSSSSSTMDALSSSLNISSSELNKIINEELSRQLQNNVDNYSENEEEAAAADSSIENLPEETNLDSIAATATAGASKTSPLPPLPQEVETSVDSSSPTANKNDQNSNKNLSSLTLPKAIPYKLSSLGSNSADPSDNARESLVSVFHNAQKSDYNKIEKYLLNALTDFERKHLQDQFHLTPITQEELLPLAPYLLFAFDGNDEKEEDLKHGHRRNCFTGELFEEKIYVLEFDYLHNNMKDREFYQIFLFYYYFPSTQEIKIYFKRRNEFIKRGSSFELHTVLTNFQTYLLEQMNLLSSSLALVNDVEQFDQKRKRDEEAIEPEVHSSSSSTSFYKRNEVLKNEFMPGMGDPMEVKLPSIGDTERAFDEFQQAFLNQTLINKEKKPQTAAVANDFRETEIIPQKSPLITSEASSKEFASPEGPSIPKKEQESTLSSSLASKSKSEERKSLDSSLVANSSTSFDIRRNTTETSSSIAALNSSRHPEVAEATEFLEEDIYEKNPSFESFSDNPHVAKKVFIPKPAEEREQERKIMEQKKQQLLGTMNMNGPTQELERNKDVHDAILTEFNSIVQNSKQKGLYSSIQQYKKDMLQYKEKEILGLKRDYHNQSSLEHLQDKELHDLFEYGRKMSDLNVQRILDRNPTDRGNKEDDFPMPSFPSSAGRNPFNMSHDSSSTAPLMIQPDLGLLTSMNTLSQTVADRVKIIEALNEQRKEFEVIESTRSTEDGENEEEKYTWTLTDEEQHQKDVEKEERQKEKLLKKAKAAKDRKDNGEEEEEEEEGAEEKEEEFDLEETTKQFIPKRKDSTKIIADLSTISSINEKGELIPSNTYNPSPQLQNQVDEALAASYQPVLDCSSKDTGYYDFSVWFDYSENPFDDPTRMNLSVIDQGRIYHKKKHFMNQFLFLVSELESNKVEQHNAILDGHRELLLSDYVISGIQFFFQQEKSFKRRLLFPKIIDKTVSLFKELIIVLEYESMKHFQTIREICDISMKYQKHNEVEFLNQIDLIKYKFDIPFLKFLNYFIRNFEDYFLYNEKNFMDLITNEDALPKEIREGDKFIKLQYLMDQYQVFHDQKQDEFEAEQEKKKKERQAAIDTEEIDTETGILGQKKSKKKKKRTREDVRDELKWYFMMKIIHQGVLQDFQSRYESLLDFAFFVIRCDKDMELHKILFNNMINAIPVLDLRYFQIICQNIISSVLYAQNPPKDLKNYILKNPSIIRQMLILEQDLFLYLNNEVIEGKLKEFMAKLAKEQDSTIEFRYRNPQRQHEEDLLGELAQENRESAFGFLKKEFIEKNIPKFGERNIDDEKAFRSIDPATPLSHQRELLELKRLNTFSKLTPEELEERYSLSPQDQARIEMVDKLQQKFSPEEVENMAHEKKEQQQLENKRQQEKEEEEFQDEFLSEEEKEKKRKVKEEILTLEQLYRKESRQQKNGRLSIQEKQEIEKEKKALEELKKIFDE